MHVVHHSGALLLLRLLVFFLTNWCVSQIRQTAFLLVAQDASPNATALGCVYRVNINSTGKAAVASPVWA